MVAIKPKPLRGDALRRAAKAERAKRELARRHLQRFIEYSFADYRAAEFQVKLCRLLERLESGQSKRVIVTVPPQHGKSTHISEYFPAWFLGRNPGKRVVCATYNQDFATNWGRAVRRVMQSQEYANVFPGVRVAGPRDGKITSASQFDLADTRGGYKAVGRGASLTGYPFHLGIIDDPFKDRLEADSEVIRAAAWDWYTSVFYTRQNPAGNAPIVVLHTRWHEDDLIGRLLHKMRNEGEGDQWEVFDFPAISEDGEPLWHERYDLDTYEGIRQVIGTRDWSALYMQRPAPGEGAVYLREWFRYWHRDSQFASNGDGSRVEIDSLFRYATVDLAVSEKASADYTAILVWGFDRARSRLYLLDVERRQISAPDTLGLLRSLRDRHRLQQIWIERTAYQLALVQFARQQDLPVRELVADRDKVARAHGVTPWIEAHHLYLPQEHRLLADLEAELFSFPLGAHDDMADSLAYGVAVARDHLSQPAVAPSFPPANQRRLAWHRD